MKNLPARFHLILPSALFETNLCWILHMTDNLHKIKIAFSRILASEICHILLQWSIRQQSINPSPAYDFCRNIYRLSRVLQ